MNGHSTSFRLIRAVCSYNPAVDSPNTQHDDELQLEEGDVLTVLGGPDIDGFYEVAPCCLRLLNFKFFTGGAKGSARYCC